jgi:hypothetical protein
VQDNVYTDIDDPIYVTGDSTDLDDNDEDTEEVFKEENPNNDEPTIQDVDYLYDEVEDESHFEKDTYSFDANEFIQDVSRRQEILDEEKQLKIQYGLTREKNSCEEGLQPKTPARGVMSQRSFNRSD